MIQKIIRIPFNNITVSNTPHEYIKKVGKKHDPLVLAGVKRLRQLVVYRLLITRKLPGTTLHPYQVAPQAQRKLQELKVRADYESRELISLGLNNSGGFLLVVPSDPRNWQVVEDFLQWLDKQLETKASHG